MRVPMWLLACAVPAQVHAAQALMEVDEVEASDKALIIEELRNAATRAIGEDLAFSPEACTTQACADRALAEGSDGILLVDVVGASTKVRLVLRRVYGDGTPQRSSTIDLRLSDTRRLTWSSLIAQAVDEIYPASERSNLLVDLAPWAVFATSALLGAGAIYFGAEAASTERALLDQPARDEIRSLGSHMGTSAIAANTLLVGSILALSGACLLVALDG